MSRDLVASALVALQVDITASDYYSRSRTFNARLNNATIVHNKLQIGGHLEPAGHLNGNFTQ